MFQRLVVVGLGNFGSWWVCGLCKLSNPLEIICYDINPKARQNLLDRIKNIPNRFKYNKKIKFVDQLSNLPADVDLVVISTNSDVRLSVYKEVSSQCSSGFWVLEKALAQSVKELKEISDVSHDKTVFVNHNRPLQPASQILKSILNNFEKPKKIVLKGGKYELASNSSHFIHLAEYLLDARMVSIDATDLASRWHHSSVRSGFYDVKGKLFVTLDSDIPFYLDWQDTEKQNAHWSFELEGSLVKYCELTGAISINNEFYANAPLINFSDLLPLAMYDSFSGSIDLNGLPTLDRVYSIHLKLTSSFAKHREYNLGDVSGVVPFS